MRILINIRLELEQYGELYYWFDDTFSVYHGGYIIRTPPGTPDWYSSRFGQSQANLIRQFYDDLRGELWKRTSVIENGGNTFYN